MIHILYYNITINFIQEIELETNDRISKLFDETVITILKFVIGRIEKKATGLIFMFDHV